MTGDRHPDASRELDAHLDELGTALGVGVARAERRRRRTRIAASAVTAIAAVGLGALVALPGGRDLDPVAQARAAVGQGNGILHFVVRSTFEPPAGSGLRSESEPPAMEVWTAMEGKESYRMRIPADGNPSVCGIATYTAATRSGRLAPRITGPMLVSPVDFAADDRTTTSYSVFSNAAVVITRPELTPRERLGGQPVVPAFGKDDPRDPVRTIRAALQSGILRDGGTVTLDGRALRRLIGRAGPTVREARALEAKDYRTRTTTRQRLIKRGQPVFPTEYAYLVDVDSFAPVELRTRRYSVWSNVGGRPHWKWTAQVDRFEQFEQLDDTPQHRALLQIPIPQGTTVYRSDAKGRFHPSVSFKRAMRDEKPAMRRCKAAIR